MPETPFTSFTLSKYRAVELLGKGGFGTVYRAIDTTLDREVALKVLHPQLVADPTFVERFRTEAKIIAALRHPNVVGVYELGEEGGRLFIAMEYMPGGTLKERLAQRGRLSFDETLTIMQQVCAGLDAAHTEGMLHRDIKPGNILFDKRGNAVVGDFGLARAMQLSSIASASSSAGGVGTPFYKAPELWNGQPPASPATDVYALACMTYEMLTGCVLFSGDTPDVIITKHLVNGPTFGTDWPPADAPEGLTEVIRRGIARNSAERYATAKAFADALIKLSAHSKKKTVLTTPVAIGSTVKKMPEGSTSKSKSNLSIWGLAIAGLVSIVLIGVVLGQPSNHSGSVALAPTSIVTISSTATIFPSETPIFTPTPKRANLGTPKPSITLTNSPEPSNTPTPTASLKPNATLSRTPTVAVTKVRASATITPSPSKAPSLATQTLSVPNGYGNVSVGGGTGQLTGRIVWNEIPMENVLLTLNFITVKEWIERAAVITDQDGRFVFRDIPSDYTVNLTPKKDRTTGETLYGGNAQTRVGDNSTVDVGDLAVYKQDLKIISPIEAAHVASNTVEIEWLAYPSAASYQVLVFADSNTATPIDVGNNIRVEFKPIGHNNSCTVYAYNKHGTKIAVGRVRFFGQ